MNQQLPSIEDYMVSLSNPQLIQANELQNGHCVKYGTITVRYAGGFCVVFPYECPTKKVALRCWHASLNNMQERSRIISEELQKSNLPYFVRFDYIKEGICTNKGIQPVVIMDWVEGVTIKEYIGEHLLESDTLLSLAEKFKVMVKDLHDHNFSHGDLQHGNIMVKPDGDIVLVDYDSMYVPALDGYPDEISGLAGYQHEARTSNKKISPKADYFSELVIYISIVAIARKPELWKRLSLEDTETMVFSADDIQSKGRNPIFSELKQIPELKEPVERLIDFMSRPSIEDLEPLEDALVPQSTKILDDIFKLIAERPVDDDTTEDESQNQLENIVRTMSKRPPIVKDSPEILVDDIISKMKN